MEAVPIGVLERSHAEAPALASRPTLARAVSRGGRQAVPSAADEDRLTGRDQDRPGVRDAAAGGAVRRTAAFDVEGAVIPIAPGT